MEETPVELHGLVERPEHHLYLCPDCGSFLDAPRVNPENGRLGRKCAACHEWHPVEAAYFRA
jgi:hypothetical protein